MKTICGKPKRKLLWNDWGDIDTWGKYDNLCLWKSKMKGIMHCSDRRMSCKTWTNRKLECGRCSTYPNIANYDQCYTHRMPFFSGSTWHEAMVSLKTQSVRVILMVINGLMDGLYRATLKQRQMDIERLSPKWLRNVSKLRSLCKHCVVKHGSWPRPRFRLCNGKRNSNVRRATSAYNVCKRAVKRQLTSGL